MEGLSTRDATASSHSVAWLSDERVAVSVASTWQAAEEIACKLIGSPVIGLDTEWNKAREAAVLQLAGAGTCLLCLLPEVDLRLCPSILRLLADGEVVKAGVGIARDAELLRQCTGGEVRGCCDLFLLAAREGLVPSAQPCGLAHLVKLLLAWELPKDEEVRKSDWGLRPLGALHVEYAARDALAGRDCALAMAQGLASSAEIAAWCGELLDRAPKMRGAPQKPAVNAATGILNCGAYACVTKFGTRRILDSEGRTMLHMRERTAEGLLRRGLAVASIENGEEVVRLRFSPSDNYEYAGLDAAERNACVSCGSSGVARFYVVPHVFFQHLPARCKSYNCHDVLMLCPACRAKAEPVQHARVRVLLASHGGVQAGANLANANPVSAEEEAARRAAKALLKPPTGRKGQLPPGKLAEFRAAVAQLLAVDPENITQEQLERVSRLGQGGDSQSPSERVCAEACADEASLRAFLKGWRELFVETLNPRFLAAGWAVDTGLDGRFVPSVAQGVEWPGDWRCENCGVHCFGRNWFCRSCGKPREEGSAAEESPTGGSSVTLEAQAQG